MLKKTLVGLFADHLHADRAITDLTLRGCPSKNISVLVHDYTASKFLHQQSTGASVAKGTTTGLEGGAVVGGLVGLLVGVGALTIPELGPLFIAGPLAAALGITGAVGATVSGALSGAVAGGLIGALVGIGMPELEAKVYEDRIRAGDVMLAATLDGATVEEEVVRDIFEQHGGESIYLIKKE